VWVVGESFLEIPELVTEQAIECLQMVLPDRMDPPVDASEEVELLSGEHAGEMVALTDLAFPGFFRIRTCEMGVYYGIRRKGALVAMGGERMLPGGSSGFYNEISGVCTHPEHRGHGFAASIIWQLVRDHRREGVASWLHVTGSNRNAIDLYIRMGFEAVRTITVRRISSRSR
jgi:ribosomal protein S18 acetylase RimI-like enzyme